MRWVIVGLVALALLVSFVVLARRRGSHRRGADDTLVTDLLGPREMAAAPASPAGDEAERPPAPQARDEAERPPAPQTPDEADRPPAPQAEEEADRPPVPSGTRTVEPSSSPSGPAADGDWLEDQLAWIAEWSQQMHQQIESAGQARTDRAE